MQSIIAVYLLITAAISGRPGTEDESRASPRPTAEWGFDLMDAPGGMAEDLAMNPTEAMLAAMNIREGVAEPRIVHRGPSDPAERKRSGTRTDEGSGTAGKTNQQAVGAADSGTPAGRTAATRRWTIKVHASSHSARNVSAQRSRRTASLRYASSQDSVRSTRQRCRPSLWLDSTPRRAIRGTMPRAYSACRQRG